MAFSRVNLPVWEVYLPRISRAKVRRGSRRESCGFPQQLHCRTRTQAPEVKGSQSVRRREWVFPRLLAAAPTAPQDHHLAVASSITGADHSSPPYSGALGTNVKKLATGADFCTVCLGERCFGQLSQTHMVRTRAVLRLVNVSGLAVLHHTAGRAMSAADKEHPNVRLV